MNKAAILFIFLFTCFLAVAQDSDGLFCKDGNKTVRLEFETKLPYLELNKPTEFKIYVENIDLKKSVIVGRGIRSLSNSWKGEYFLCTVTIDEEGVVDGHYKMTFGYDRSDDEDIKICTFTIPVKQ